MQEITDLFYFMWWKHICGNSKLSHDEANHPEEWEIRMVIKQGAVRKQSSCPLFLSIWGISAWLWSNHLIPVAEVTTGTLVPLLFRNQDQVHRWIFSVQTGTIKWSLKFTYFLLELLLDTHWQNSFLLPNKTF